MRGHDEGVMAGGWGFWLSEAPGRPSCPWTVTTVGHIAFVWRGTYLLRVCQVLGTVSVPAENWYDVRNPCKPALGPEIPTLLIDSFGLSIMLFSLGIKY